MFFKVHFVTGLGLEFKTSNSNPPPAQGLSLSYKNSKSWELQVIHLTFKKHVKMHPLKNNNTRYIHTIGGQIAVIICTWQASQEA